MNKTKVSFALFTGVDDNQLYYKYLQIKYRVFVQELNFHIDYDKLNSIALPDEFDSNGLFAIALDEMTEPVGILRAVFSKDGFPKKELIKHHLENNNVSPLLGNSATLNALAVKQEYRSKRYKILNNGTPQSIATVLSLLILEYLEKTGTRLVFLNATVGAAVYVYYKLGFKVIDPPYIYQANHPAVVNMAILIPNLTYGSFKTEAKRAVLNPQEISCMEYLDEMEKKVLGTQSIWSFFRSA